MKKKITFAVILNSFTTVTSVLYFVIAVAVFIGIIALFGSFGGTGHSTDAAGFAVFFLIVLIPLEFVFVFFPITRLVALISSVLALNKLKKQKSPKGNMVLAGILQIWDAISTWIFLGLAIVIAVNPGMVAQMFGSIGYSSPNAVNSLISMLLCILVGIPVLAKNVLQIVSAVILFKATRLIKPGEQWT